MIRTPIPVRTFADNVFRVFGSSDSTKLLAFEVDGFTTGTTRTVTFPDASLTAAGVNFAQTWSAIQKFPDNILQVVGSADATKILAFEVDGFTTGTTRTWTVPDRSDTVAGLAAQTFTGIQRFPAGAANAVAVGLNSTTNGLYASGTNELAFATNSTHAALFNSARQFIIGHTAALAVGGVSGQLYQLHSAGSGSAMAFARYSNDTSGTIFYLGKTRGVAIADFAAVTSGDDLGQIRVCAGDGTNLATNAARIEFACDGTVSTGVVPGRMRLKTATSGGTVTAAVIIDNTQTVIWGALGDTQSALATFNASALTPRMQGLGTSVATSSFAQIAFPGTTAANAPVHILARSRASGVGTYTAVASGDTLGIHAFEGADGTDLARAASIRGLVDNTVASNQVPGRIEIYTANSSGTETLALTIDSSQNVTHKDGGNVILGTTTGTKIGTGTTQKLGIWNATPIAQPATTGETVGFTAGAGTAVTDQSTFTGNVGSTAYRISDIVKHLKNIGLIAA